MGRCIEWFLNLFFRDKALEVKREAQRQREQFILDYAKSKEANAKYLKKYSSRGRKFLKP